MSFLILITRRDFKYQCFCFLPALASLVSDIIFLLEWWDRIEGTSSHFTQFSLSSHLYYLRIKLIMFLSKPFLFRCTLQLFKSILELMPISIMNFNLASLNTCKSSSLTSNALLLRLSFPGTIPDILTFQDWFSFIFLHVQ